MGHYDDIREIIDEREHHRKIELAQKHGSGEDTYIIKVGLPKPQKGDTVRVEYVGEYTGDNSIGEPIIRWEEGVGQWRSSILPKKALREVVQRAIKIDNIVTINGDYRKFRVKGLDTTTRKAWCQDIDIETSYLTFNISSLRFHRES